MKNERIIPALPGTRAVYVSDFKVSVRENIIAFVTSAPPEGIYFGDLYVLTAKGTWDTSTLNPIDENGDSAGMYGILFPNGVIDAAEFETYESIEELQDYLNRLNPELRGNNHD